MGKSTKGDRDRVLYTVKWESLLGSGEREFASKDAARIFIVAYLQHASRIKISLEYSTMFDVSKIKFRLDDDGYVVAETKFTSTANKAPRGLDNAVIYTIVHTYEALLGRKPTNDEVQAGLDLFQKSK